MNTSLRLPDTEYFHEVAPKNLIVLHHTVGGSAKSTLDWWVTDPKRIGTAYLVERDGTVYETFPPQMWASHINRKDAEGKQIRSLEQRSIGIELCNEGPLTRRNGKFYCYDRVSERTEFTGPVFDCGKVWRDRWHFAAYPILQIDAVADLVKNLCLLFLIPREIRSPEWIEDVAGLTGIVSHAQLRKDKSDVHLGFPLEVLL